MKVTDDHAAAPAETIIPLAAWDGSDVATLLSLEQAAVDCFTSRYARANANGAIFGGQLIGQALMAALRTVESTRIPHAFHGFFTRAASNRAPLDFGVERVRDGSSFSHRRVTVSQERRTVFSAEVSFHQGETGDDHAPVLKFDVPLPEQLPTLAELVDDYATQLPPAALRRLSRPHAGVDVRIANLETLLSRGSAREPMLYWLRVARGLPDTPCWHAAALGYLSDYWLAAPFRMLPGAPHHPGEVVIASLDQSLWIHRPFRADHWLLMVHEVPTEQLGRRLNQAKIYDREGRLVASSAQEALMRLAN